MGRRLKQQAVGEHVRRLRLQLGMSLQGTIGEFFMAAAQGEGGVVVRSSDRQAMASGWSNAEVEALSPMAPDRRLEPTIVTLAPGGRSGKHPYARPHEEFILVLGGEVSLTLGPEVHTLATGDAATILPRELRLFQNLSDRPTQILVVAALAPRRDE